MTSRGRSRAASRTVRTSRSRERNCAPASSASSGSPPGMPAPSRSRTCCHGHSGGAPSSWEQRPTSTSTPRARATAASSALSRDLPMPGSPVSTAYVAAPVTAVSRAPSSASRSRSRPTIGQAATGSTARAASGAGSGGLGGRGACGPASGATQSSAGSWRSTADWRSRSSAPGSRPSSSASTVRTLLSTSSASAWRPDRASASARRCHSRSRSGWAAVSASSSAATVPWWPSARSASIRCSSATSRSSSSRARSATACGASSSSPYGVPRQSARASSRPATASVSTSRPTAGGPIGTQGLQGALPGADGGLEDPGVQGVVGDPQRVARRHGDQHGGRGAAFPVGLDHPAQARDVRLQRGAHARRRRVAPEQVDDRVDRDRAAAGEGQRGHQRPLLGRAEVDRAPVQLHLDRAEDCDLHVRSIGIPGRPRARFPPRDRAPGRPTRSGHPDPAAPVRSCGAPTRAFLPAEVSVLACRSVSSCASKCQFLRAEVSVLR